MKLTNVFYHVYYEISKYIINFNIFIETVLPNTRLTLMVNVLRVCSILSYLHYI